MGLPWASHRKQGFTGAWGTSLFIELVSSLTIVKEDSVSLPPRDIRLAAHKTALREINAQREQFQRLGIMADWSNESTYRTIGTFMAGSHLQIIQEQNRSFLPDETTENFSRHGRKRYFFFVWFPPGTHHP
jgi:hypothetical protein